MSPIPTNKHEEFQWNMVNAHQALKNGFDSILKHLENPPLHDLANFLGYCRAFGQSLSDHHDGEERIYFPFLNKKLDFSGEASAHKVIHEKLDQLFEYVTASEKDESHFYAAQMKSMMEELRQPLYAHLDEEVEHISPEKMKVFSEEELVDMEDEHLKFIKSHANPWLAMPFVMGATSPDAKATWPPLPWVLRRVLIPYVFALKYRGYWKYSPYSMA